MAYEIIYTDIFDKWLRSLKDRHAKARIKVRLDRILEGNFGLYKSLGGSLAELKIDTGKGYRVYYTIRKQTVVMLLCGSTKASQEKTIAKARSLLAHLEE